MNRGACELQTMGLQELDATEQLTHPHTRIHIYTHTSSKSLHRLNVKLKTGTEMMAAQLLAFVVCQLRWSWFTFSKVFRVNNLSYPSTVIVGVLLLIVSLQV